MPDEPMSLRRARELDDKARANSLPTPRQAMLVLLAADAAELDDLERRRTEVLDRLRARTLRANYLLDDQGRGLPEHHPDRLSLNELVEPVGRHRGTINHWFEDLLLGPPVQRGGVITRDPSRARHDLIPTYRLHDDQMR